MLKLLTALADQTLQLEAVVTLAVEIPGTELQSVAVSLSNSGSIFGIAAVRVAAADWFTDDTLPCSFRWRYLQDSF